MEFKYVKEREDFEGDIYYNDVFFMKSSGARKGRKVWKSVVMGYLDRKQIQYLEKHPKRYFTKEAIDDLLAKETKQKKDAKLSNFKRELLNYLRETNKKEDDIVNSGEIIWRTVEKIDEPYTEKYQIMVDPMRDKLMDKLRMSSIEEFEDLWKGAEWRRMVVVTKRSQGLPIMGTGFEFDWGMRVYEIEV